MARYTRSKNKLSRREGVDLFGKGNKLRRATVPPGQHGSKRSRRRPSDYNFQLREKQKTRRFYGIMERQFRKYFEKARSVRGATGEILLRLLELRLDNVVYRSGLASSRPMARQLVSHRHVLIDDKIVNLPSYQVKPGQTITLDEAAQKNPNIQPLLINPDVVLPAWIKRQGAVAAVQNPPSRQDIDTPVNEQLIVEYYSRRI